MNSFLSMLTNPFNSRSAAPELPLPPRPALITKAPIYKASGSEQTVYDPRRWSIWGAAYGGQTTPAATHWPAATIGRCAGRLRHRPRLPCLTLHIVGFALAGGGTNFGISNGFGSGHSDMFQAAVYSSTSINAAYVSTALAYAWHRSPPTAT